MQTWKKIALGALAATTVLGGAAAVAVAKDGFGWRQGGPGGPGPKVMMERVFTEMDRGAKGNVTQEDLTVFIDAKFAEADADKSGFVSETELAAFAAKQAAPFAEKMFTRFAGTDGKIAIAGRLAMSPMADRARAADTNKDGAVDRAEFDKAIVAVAGKRTGGVYDILADGDKGIAKARLADIAKRRFARADADKNGLVTKDEFEASMPRGGRGMQGGHHGQRHGGADGFGPRYGMMQPGGQGMQPGQGYGMHPGQGHGMMGQGMGGQRMNAPMQPMPTPGGSL